MTGSMTVGDNGELAVGSRVVGRAADAHWKECISAQVRWSRWYFSLLYWNHVSALLLLQGATIQQLLGERFVLLGGVHAPSYHSRPSVCGALLAEILEAPEGYTIKDCAKVLLS